jgi:alanine-synthesizing transaminase
MKKLVPARRSRGIRYAVRDVLAVADQARAAGREVLYLNIGDPNLYGFVTPPAILEAITRALRDNRNGYAPSPGVPAALEALRADAAARGIQAVRDVFIGNGCSEVIDLALSALCDEGDDILTPYPGYPLYGAIEARLGLRTNPYFLAEDDDWQPDLADLAAKIGPRTRAIVVINPNNPTGGLYRRDVLEGIIELARRHDLLLIADEIYDKLLLDEDACHVPLASLANDVAILSLGGLSKAYLGPGLRIGWGVLSGPAAALDDYVDAIHKFLRARLSANHPIQYAIPVALATHDHLPAVQSRLRAQRDLTVERLAAIPGIAIVAPRAAFYAFPRLLHETDDMALISDLIRATGVVVVPGSGFGQRPGTAHFRVVFLPDVAVLARAYAAIADFLACRQPIAS